MVKEKKKGNPVISTNLFQKMPNVFYYPIAYVAYQRSVLKEQSSKNSTEKAVCTTICLTQKALLTVLIILHLRHKILKHP